MYSIADVAISEDSVLSIVSTFINDDFKISRNNLTVHVHTTFEKKHHHHLYKLRQN